MNLFGIEIKLVGKNNNGNSLVKKGECREAQNAIKLHLDQALIRIHSDIITMRQEIKDDTNIRFGDLKSSIEIIKDFMLKK